MNYKPPVKAKSGDHAQQLIMEGKPVTYLGKRVLLIERHNTITETSQWRVECPVENIFLPFAESPHQAAAMWYSVTSFPAGG